MVSILTTLFFNRVGNYKCSDASYCLPHDQTICHLSELLRCFIMILFFFFLISLLSIAL